MTQEHPMPLRPRLADHITLRRTVIDGASRIAARDGLSGIELELTEEALALICCADGTRDLGGVVLEAVRRGVFHRASELEALLAELHARGFLTDGIEPGLPHRLESPHRPLAPLPGYRLHCDGNGTCCRSHDGVTFSLEEAARARALVPDALEPSTSLELSFPPIISSTPSFGRAVTFVDGQCPYLDSDGRCRIQVAGGPEAKPRGCQIFPSTFVDDGQTIHVSVLLECPCVLKSVDCLEGADLVPAGAKEENDLIPGTQVLRLPEEIALAADRYCAREELRRWSTRLLERLDEVGDALAFCWSLADLLEAPAPDLEKLFEIARDREPPQATTLGFRLMRLASLAEERAELIHQRRAGETQSGQLSLWIARESARLVDFDVTDRLLQSEISKETQRRERFLLQASLFGYHLVTNHALCATVADALRDRTIRTLLARQLDSCPMEQRPPHPAAAYPLVAVEILMRGQGLERYQL